MLQYNAIDAGLMAGERVLRYEDTVRELTIPQQIAEVLKRREEARDREPAQPRLSEAPCLS